MSVMKFDFTVKNLIIILVSAAVIFLLLKLQPLVTIFAVSFFIAYIFDPFIDWLETLKISRTLAIALLYLIAVVICFLMVSYLVPVLYDESVHLAASMPKYFQKLFAYVEDTAVRLNLDISLEGIKSYIIPKLGVISNAMLSSADSVLASAKSIVNLVLNLALIPILTFYFLKDFDVIRDKMFEKFSGRAGVDYPAYFMEFNALLSRYFRGQVLVAVILGVLYTIVLLISGVKPAILLGLIAGILSVVPYLGFIIGFGASLILSIAQYGDLLHPAMVITGFVIVQALEGNFITPKIVGGSLGLHPTAVIFSLMAGGSLMGIGGMIIALPIASFIKVIADKYLDN
jgi:predicted PurR-regulated permease PerM